MDPVEVGRKGGNLLTKAEKAEVIDYLTGEFKEAQAVTVCDYKGMTVRELEALRGKAREKEIKVKVVKNTLAMIAMKSADIEGLELKETNMLLWAEDQVELSKMIMDHKKEHEEFSIRSGYMDGKIVDENAIEAISKLPSKEQLIGMLLSTWTAPMRNMASVLQAPLRDAVNVINNYKEQKENA